MAFQFRVVESAAVYPARCRCGSVKAPLVDTLINDALGRLYVCSRCVAQMAALLGWTSPEDMSVREVAFQQLGATVARLGRELAEAKAAQLTVVDVEELLRRAREGEGVAA